MNETKPMSTADQRARLRSPPGTTPGRQIEGSPWWTPPAALTDGSDYSNLISRAAARDRAALRLPELDTLPPVPVEARSFVRRITHIGVQIEDMGGAAAEALLTLDLPVALRAGLKRAMWDEIRHSELLGRLEATLDDIPPPDREPVVDKLLATLDAATTGLEFAVVHVLLEAEASDIFRLIARSQRENVLGRVYAVINADETAHVELGFAVASHVAKQTADIDRAAIEHISDKVFAISPQTNDIALAAMCTDLSLDLRPTRSYFSECHARRLNQLDAVISRP